MDIIIRPKRLRNGAKKMTWKIKLDPETKSPVFDEDRIVYLDPDGKELALNPPAMYQKIADLGKENQKHRLKFDEMKKKFEIFSGIEDISEYKTKADEALQTVANFNDKDWMKAEKVDKLKSEITSAYEEKIKNINIAFGEKEKSLLSEMDKKQNQIRRLLISNKFAISKYFSGGGDKSKTILPSNIAEDHFGKFFKVEEGPDGLPITRAYYNDGDPVISRVNPGEPADFEEAIGLIIDKYPNKESILRSGFGGSGSSGSSGDNADDNDLTTLRRKYADAKKEGNMQLAISLNNRINALMKKTA